MLIQHVRDHGLYAIANFQGTEVTAQDLDQLSGASQFQITWETLGDGVTSAYHKQGYWFGTYVDDLNQTHLVRAPTLKEPEEALKDLMTIMVKTPQGPVGVTMEYAKLDVGERFVSDQGRVYERIENGNIKELIFDSQNRVVEKITPGDMPTDFSVGDSPGFQYHVEDAEGNRTGEIGFQAFDKMMSGQLYTDTAGNKYVYAQDSSGQWGTFYADERGQPIFPVEKENKDFVPSIRTGPTSSGGVEVTGFAQDPTVHPGTTWSADDPDWELGPAGRKQDAGGILWQKESDGNIYRVDPATGQLMGAGEDPKPRTVAQLNAAQLAGLGAGESKAVTFPDGTPVPGMHMWSDGKSVHLMKSEQGMAVPQDLITLATADYNGLGQAIAELANMASGRAGPDKKITWEQAQAGIDQLKTLYAAAQTQIDQDEEMKFQSEQAEVSRTWQGEQSQLQRTWQAGETEKQRTWQTGESAKERASREEIARRGRIAQRATAYSGQQSDLFQAMAGYAVAPGVDYVSGHGPGGAAAGMAKITGQTYVPEEHKVQRQPVDFIKMARQGESLAREGETYAAG